MCASEESAPRRDGAFLAFPHSLSLVVRSFPLFRCRRGRRNL